MFYCIYHVFSKWNVYCGQGGELFSFPVELVLVWKGKYMLQWEMRMSTKEKLIERLIKQNVFLPKVNTDTLCVAWRGWTSLLDLAPVLVKHEELVSNFYYYRIHRWCIMVLSFMYLTSILLHLQSRYSQHNSDFFLTYRLCVVNL